MATSSPRSSGYDKRTHHGDRHASNGLTEAIDCRLEARPGFRNLTHYRIRSLLHCGNLTHLIDAL
jgi:transposase